MNATRSLHLRKPDFKRLAGSSCITNSGLFSIAIDVTQNCGLRQARFKQQSEARRQRISKTRWAFAVSCFAGIYRQSVKLGRDWIARRPVVDNL
jgi:alpha-D-ribose 1-methylphosphonate 5-triphosphate synthase subunit PhnL